jgi:hypothetical protein
METGSQTRGYLHGASNFPAHVEDSSPPSARCLPRDSISRTELPLAPEMFARGNRDLRTLTEIVASGKDRSWRFRA